MVKKYVTETEYKNFWQKIHDFRQKLLFIHIRRTKKLRVMLIYMKHIRNMWKHIRPYVHLVKEPYI